ncbi:MAG: hypothetical protein HFI75_11880 [Lachnospiraceae bacterium]|nr:hypothetical protein [Lachnospiraceae bacterium]
MILSMYYPIFDGDTCIGYVGAGVYASRLMDEISAASVEQSALISDQLSGQAQTLNRLIGQFQIR